jgi:putative ABC transport system permease protein
MGSAIPKAETGMYKTGLNLFPEDGLGTPTNEEVRLCFADFFTMFQVPFRYGGPWQKAADDGSSALIVIDSATNRRLFGGENSVGERLKLEDRYFTVVGVLEPWRPAVKYYDPHNGAYQLPEAIFMPFGFGRILEADTEGNSWGWTSWDGDAFEDQLQSEDLWLQMWVELENEAQRQEFAAYLDAYVLEQQKAGRLLRPVNNRLLTVMEWLAQKDVVPEQARALLVISLLFLVVCSVNLIGIFLGKFLARSPEVGVRRALGATRASVFFQHVVECELVGLLGGAIGIVASIGVMTAMDRLMNMHGLFRLDLPMAAVAVGLSLAAGLVAGVYPSWRICHTAPATHLKLQ